MRLFDASVLVAAFSRELASAQALALLSPESIIPLSIIPITGFPIARRGLRGNTP
jgi:hypothetical protein